MVIREVHPFPCELCRPIAKLGVDVFCGAALDKLLLFQWVSIFSVATKKKRGIQHAPGASGMLVSHPTVCRGAQAGLHIAPARGPPSRSTRLPSVRSNKFRLPDFCLLHLSAVGLRRPTFKLVPWRPHATIACPERRRPVAGAVLFRTLVPTIPMRGAPCFMFARWAFGLASRTLALSPRNVYSVYALRLLVFAVLP